MSKGHGNSKLQNKRRRQRKHKLPVAQPYMFQLIDGNFSKYPIGYCKFRKSWLTVGLVEVHKCENCKQYEDGVNC